MGIYENIDGMKASKMKENLINDKEQAFLSKTLATIDTKAPIEIGLKDLVYSGPDVENLGKFYEEMGFKQLKQALNVSSTDVAESLNFTIIDQIRQDMLSEESIFHFELFGENYHTDDLVGFAWSCGDKLYATDKLELLQEPIFKDFLEKTPLRVYDFKKAKVLLNRFGVGFAGACFLTVAWLNTSFRLWRTMKLRLLLVFMVRLIWLMMRLSMVRGSRRPFLT